MFIQLVGTLFAQETRAEKPVDSNALASSSGLSRNEREARATGDAGNALYATDLLIEPSTVARARSRAAGLKECGLSC